MTQEIITYSLVGIALLLSGLKLYKKFSRKTDSSCGGCTSNGCDGCAVMEIKNEMDRQKTKNHTAQKKQAPISK